ESRSRGHLCGACGRRRRFAGNRPGTCGLRRDRTEALDRKSAPPVQGRADSGSVSLDDRAERRWPGAIVAVHWGTGLLALTVAGLAIYLLSPPDWSQPYIDRYMAWIGWHKLGGLLVLGLALFWVSVRMRMP